MVKAVSDTVHTDWETVFKMKIIEFFNISSFIKDYNNYQKSEYEKMMNKNKVRRK